MMTNMNRGGFLRHLYVGKVLPGPVGYDYNGSSPPEILQIRDVTITDCDFGTPVNSEQSVYTCNVMTLPASSTLRFLPDHAAPRRLIVQELVGKAACHAYFSVGR